MYKWFKGAYIHARCFSDSLPSGEMSESLTRQPFFLLEMSFQKGLFLLRAIIDHSSSVCRINNSWAESQQFASTVCCKITVLMQSITPGNLNKMPCWLLFFSCIKASVCWDYEKFDCFVPCSLTKIKICGHLEKGTDVKFAKYLISQKPLRSHSVCSEVCSVAQPDTCCLFWFIFNVLPTRLWLISKKLIRRVQNKYVFWN